jgi:hypothetical protein
MKGDWRTFRVPGRLNEFRDSCVDVDFAIGYEWCAPRFLFRIQLVSGSTVRNLTVVTSPKRAVMLERNAKDN